MQSCAPGISPNIFKVLNCLRYLEKECFLNSLMRNCYFVTLKLKFGLSEKHTKFEKNFHMLLTHLLQYCLDIRKPDLRKNLDLRKIVAKTDFLVHKLFDLRKIF